MLIPAVRKRAANSRGNTMTDQTLKAPIVRRERLPMVRRKLVVEDKLYITPGMIRLVLGGEELAGFLSPSPDDNIKIIITDKDGNPAMRSYTPRRYDAVKNQLIVDFAVHEAGPATQWALDVKRGDAAVIGGPRGSKIVEGDICNWVLIGDETALPAMLRRVEEASAGTKITMIASVPAAVDEQVIETQADFTPIWVHRNGVSPDAEGPLLEQLEHLTFEPGSFVWLAAEGRLTRTLRTYLNEERNVPLNWIRATGYWVKGQADSTAKFD